VKAEPGADEAAITITGTAQRRAWLDNVLPPVESVRPGLWSVPVPVGTGVMRYSNIYVLESTDGVTLIDAGWDDENSWSALCGGLTSIGFDITDVRRVLVTHAHRDHYGQAARVRRASGAVIAMHADEAATLVVRFDSVDVLKDRMFAWLHSCGVSQQDAPEMIPNVYTQPSDMPNPDVLPEDGEKMDVPGWNVHAHLTPGHSPGHLTFHEQDRALLLTGDHILPRITPNVSLNPRQMGNMLGHYLASLDKLVALCVEEVLPAHEYRFSGLDVRIGQLRRHHRERLGQLFDNVADRPGSTSWQLAERSRWARPWSETPPLLRRLAVGETVAHLVLLEGWGCLRRKVADGVDLWSVGAVDPASMLP
jgi:glyoxylase-like metal-dependent hydrolase (beta-lactamase superfamily II)